MTTNVCWLFALVPIDERVVFGWCIRTLVDWKLRDLVRKLVMYVGRSLRGILRESAADE